ncbi:CC0125/CC1285 family lipoprotein [Pseudidiomarina sp. CB1]|uniref:CC0125/CC1285 family lipoprotein n=1 Tax=Pseudidiomarina sp. CB1 TaxID=2972484 RepID=UPI00216365D4|nr:hypothetical protein [Pseudidiomarina sp. CB1]
MLIRTFVVLVVSFVVGACASEPDYRAAENGGYGYTETKITDTDYQVEFKARGSDKGAAMNYALLRAAEVTLENDHDWFVITHRETQIDKETIRDHSFDGMAGGDMVTYCNMIRCETRYYPRSAFSAGIHVGGRTDSDIQVTLDIQLGSGSQPQDKHSYDASEVVANLKPKSEE